MEANKHILKIRISDGELYELEVNEPINVNELPYILSKLNKLNKFGQEYSNNEYDFSDIPIPNILKSKKKYVLSKPRKLSEWKDTREKSISLMELAFYGTKEERNLLTKKYKTTWDNMSKSFHDFKRRYNIKPEEIGLKRFIKLGESRSKQFIETLKIPGYQYKQSWRQYHG
jgi:hypothetical protein